MSNYVAARIKKQGGFSGKSKQRDLKPKVIIGFDSEADTTSDGRPMLFQFSLPDTAEQAALLFVLPEDKQHAGLRCFIEFLETYCKRADFEYVIYGFNNQYELTQIFHDLPKEVKNESDFTITGISTKDGHKYGWIAEVFNNKRHMIIFRKGKVKVTFLDAAAFYKTSLDKAAKMLGLGEKYTSDNLDRTKFTREHLKDEEFLFYSRRDAYITRLIGEYIQSQHKTLNINTTISAPHFASTVFKTHFMNGGIMIPSEKMEQAGLYSYHGGKNGFYLDGPTEFPSIYQYDITSAYPEAMRQLPDIENSGWRKIDRYIPGAHALYQVSMNYNRCEYGGIQNHDGSWANAGVIEDIWLTSYELDELYANHEVEQLFTVTGYQCIGPNGGALSDYVDRYFSAKRNSTGPERETAKLLLNSLYGKFFQKQPVGSVGNFNIDTQRWISTNPDRDYDYEAGGLYNPPIASLITGYVRAKIHRLEHKYESVMTSTDGIFATNPPDESEIGTELGMLTVTKGRLRIWRERLYIFNGDDGKDKFALHGFHGVYRRKSPTDPVSELEEIPLAKGSYGYMGRQLITLKMSTKETRGLQHGPGEIVILPFTITI